MAWNDVFDGLFKRKVPKTEVEALFNRMDVEQFFKTLNNIWSPSELIRKVGGYQKLDILYKDQDIYAAIDKRTAALLTSKLSIEGEDKSLVEFFEKQILPHERQLKLDFWWSIYNGYGVEQIIYDEDMSGKVKGFQREQFWRFEPQKDLIHVKCVVTSNRELMNKILPYGKWVLTTSNGTSSNPYGDAMAERLITPWIFKCTGWDLWIDFAKRFANGFLHAAIEDEKKAREVRQALESAGKSSILVTDKNTAITLTQPNRDSSLYSLIDDKTVRAIQKVILGETQTSDMAERGSSGSAGVQNEVRQEKTWADIDLVEKALNETIRQIGDVNGFDPDSLPKAVLSWEPDFSLEQVTRDTGLYGMGVRFNKEYYKKTYGLDPEDYEIQEVIPSYGFKAFNKLKQLSSRSKSTFLSPDEIKAFLGQDKSCTNCATVTLDSVSRKVGRSRNENEDIVDLLVRNGEEPINVDDLISAIQTSSDSKDLEEKLNALFDQRNASQVDLLTEALYYAAAKGALLGNPEVIKDEEE